MELAAIATWGTPKPGYFKPAFDVFKEGLSLFEILKKEGKITGYEVYSFGTGDPDVINGITILRGQEASIYALQQDPRVRAMMTKAVLVVSHFALNFAVFGEPLMQMLAANEKIVETLERVPVGAGR